MNKLIIFFYGITAYVVALVGQIWFILYLTQWDIIEETIYTTQKLSTVTAIEINILLITLFGVQHSMMARSWFKSKLTKLLPIEAERSTYVLLSGVVFILISLLWQPIDGMVWSVDEKILRTLLWGGFLFGWIFSVVATFVINHFELFGLQQVYLQLLDREPPKITFQERLFYKFVRHPIQLGVLIGLWVTPVMTYGHLLLTLFFSIYIFVGLYFEEKDLVSELGEVYVAYKKRVGYMFPKKK